MIRPEKEGGGDEDKPNPLPIGRVGGSVDQPICLLCGAFHAPVFSLRDCDAARPGQVNPRCPSMRNPALFTFCSLAGKIARDSQCCMEVAEHAIRFMLTQGAHWVPTDQNQRAMVSSSSTSSPTLGPRKEITEMPATSISLIQSMEASKIEELLMLYFKNHLGRPNPRWAGLNALMSVSNYNLNGLRTAANKSLWEADQGSRKRQLFELMMGFSLSLTHYADGPRGLRPVVAGKKPKSEADVDQDPPCFLSLYSRILLDTHAPALGIEGYPVGNTPSMAFKNVGHVDFVFFAIEPRTAGTPVTKPFKVSSRFGRFCHMVDFDQLPFCSILTLGDLDTCNAKIGVNRLTCGSDPMTAPLLGFGDRSVFFLKDKCVERTTNPSASGASQTIWVRKFRSMSEQIFIRDHMREALALKVLIDCQAFGFLGSGECSANPTAADYNCLINGLFVPQIMIPHAFCTEQAYMFEGEKSEEEIKAEKKEKEEKPKKAGRK